MIDEKMIFTNSRGEEIEFGRKRPYILTRIRDSLDADVQTQKAPFQDGTTYIDTLMDEREITLELAIFERTQTQVFERRAEISRVLNPKLGEGTLKYLYGDQEKEVKVVVERAPKFLSGQENRSPDFQSVRVNLLCPSPFWLDIEESSQQMITLEGGFSLPTSFPFNLATTSGLSEVDIFVNSDVPTPVRIDFEGEAVNPKVENKTTGEFVKIAQTIQEGEVLEINTAFGNKYARIGNDNVLHYIDLDSTFWQLQPGWNTIEYTMDSGDGRVNLYWKNRYLGV